MERRINSWIACRNIELLTKRFFEKTNVETLFYLSKNEVQHTAYGYEENVDKRYLLVGMNELYHPIFPSLSSFFGNENVNMKFSNPFALVSEKEYLYKVFAIPHEHSHYLQDVEPKTLFKTKEEILLFEVESLAIVGNRPFYVQNYSTWISEITANQKAIEVFLEVLPELNPEMNAEKELLRIMNEDYKSKSTNTYIKSWAEPKNDEFKNIEELQDRYEEARLSSPYKPKKFDINPKPSSTLERQHLESLENSPLYIFLSRNRDNLKDGKLKDDCNVLKSLRNLSGDKSTYFVALTNIEMKDLLKQRDIDIEKRLQTLTILPAMEYNYKDELYKFLKYIGEEPEKYNIERSIERDKDRNNFGGKF